MGPTSGTAQGISTAAIRGAVSALDGTDVTGASVTVTSGATGFAVEATVLHGRFLIEGLEVGGPYTVTVRHQGFLTQRREGVFLALGAPLELDVLLQRAAIAVDSLQVVVTPLPAATADGGAAATIDDRLIRGLPSLDRDLYDFVRLVPQISTRTGFRWGFSAVGAGIRSNEYLINGVSERTPFANATAALSGGRSIPLAAVREYQVLVTPYDVRHGGFSGALVGAVTRSGTNRWEGELFAYGRNQDLVRRDSAEAPFERLHYGVLLGGPLVRDRLHFLVATEIERASEPAPGPWVEQGSVRGGAPVREEDLVRLEQILRSHGLEAGSGGMTENRSPFTNVFGRLDLAIPRWGSRAVAWANFGYGTADSFSREGPASFPLTSFRAPFRNGRLLASAQLYTALPRGGGGQNELLVSANMGAGDWIPVVRQPIVNVLVPTTSGGLVSVTTGTPELAQESETRFRSLEVRDHLTLPIGASHVLSLGASAERFRVEHNRVWGTYGSWTFSDLDALVRGEAESYVIRRDFGAGRVPIAGAQYGVHLGDRWQVGRRLSLTLGVRADLLAIDGTAPYDPVVDEIFGRRTDDPPPRGVHLSPRLGFTWDRSGTGRDRLRGGVGVFTGRPPLAWLHAALANYGVGAAVLRCGSHPLDAGPAPAFVADYRRAPDACATGPGVTTAPRGNVNLLAADLRLPQTLRLSLAYDVRLPWGMLFTGEALAARGLSEPVFVNLNLAGPQAVDRHGRVLYGSIPSTGIAEPELRSGFVEVIDLQNTSRNRALQLSARLERRLPNGSSMLASYTHARVRDVQAALRTGGSGTENWSSKAVWERHEDLWRGISLNDVPHRIVLAGTFRAPWRRWSTDFSFYWVGESGSPFTYVAWGVTSRGDLNADGSNANDPVYVPVSALDTAEIRFTASSPVGEAGQRAAFEQFVERTPCLRRQRGRILERNSCRAPWSHTTAVGVRQTIPAAGRSVEAELQVFNLLNLLRASWGLTRVPSPRLLEHVGHTDDTAGEARPIFRFDAERTAWATDAAASAFHLQVGLRYRF